MIKSIVLLGSVFATGSFVFCQVGINTQNPAATLDVVAKTNNGSKPEGFVAPRLTGDQIKSGDSQYGSAQTGVLVYVTAAVTVPSTKTAGIVTPGYYYYDGNVWKPLFGSGAAVTADSSTSSFQGSYFTGVPMTSANKFSVNIINNSFSPATMSFAPSDLTLSGVTGVTVSSVTPTSATLNSGQNQTVSYGLSGTPSSVGTIVGTWSKLALNSVKTAPVYTPLTSLNCSGAVHTGTLTSGTAASGVSSVIFYTGGNGDAYNGVTINSTGITGLTATLSSGTLANGSGSLTYVITGTPSSDGTANFPISIGGQNCTFSRTVVLPAAGISGLNCSGASNNGTLTSGTVASGVSTVIPYTGGNGGAYSGQTINSTGVTGLTATLSSGTLGTGSGNLTYVITGTPSSSGTANFTVNIGGQSCTFSRTVTTPYVVPVNITLAQNRKYFFVSVYDQDYLPYTFPSVAATTSVQAADGSNESVTVDIQGSLSTAGITVRIPITATGSGILPAYSTTVNVPSSMTQDGISRDLTLSWASQAYTSTTTLITASLSSVGGPLNVKKLDINAGIGNDTLGVLLGTLTYPYNNAGNTTNFEIRDIAPLPDRMFGLADNGGVVRHNFLYVPMFAEDGKVWLNNNLGAHYSNINHAAFNPLQQATSETDYLAYGSLFQWGRKGDGHELMTYTSPLAAPTPVNGVVSGIHSEPLTTPMHIIYGGPSYGWRTPNDDTTLWATAASSNNPCPSGFRVPSVTELQNIFNITGIYNGPSAYNNSLLRLTTTGVRDHGGSIATPGVYAHYWSSSAYTGDVTYSLDISFNNTGTGIVSNAQYRAQGFSVRCLKD